MPGFLPSLPSCITVSAAALLLAIGGCDSVERATPGPQTTTTKPSFDIEVEPVMRGTVASQAVVVGYEPTIVHGYGLVVGLNGTGSRNVPPALREQMIQEMSRRGIGSERYGLGHLEPEAMLNSLDTAVVLVEAVIPPGAVAPLVDETGIAIDDGTRFDVRVSALPNDDTLSLEGGRLYTAPLQPRYPQNSRSMPPVGSRQAAALAEAGGEIFINPFAEPGAVGRDAINRRTGRILNGGYVLKDMPIKLRLARPSHTTASIMQSAINGRFPREYGQPDITARGESDEALAVTVPTSYRDRTAEFVQLLYHMTIRSVNVEAVAASISRMLQANPDYANEAAWRWQALGVRALPVVSQMYDYPEEALRLAALRAGAKLDHPPVIPHLIDLAKTGSSTIRRDAIALLGDMRVHPQIDHALRGLLNDESMDVRLAAYEALAQRGDPLLTRHVVDGKFLLDIVESDKPMIYVTQVGQPRIVLFGDLSVGLPCFVRAWSNRLMVNADEADEKVEVFYRPEEGGGAVIRQVEPDLESLITYLAHETSIERPEPGLGLSYGETVGALHAIWSERYIDAEFKGDRDRVLAAMLEVEQQSTVEERPLFATATGGDAEQPVLDGGGEPQTDQPRFLDEDYIVQPEAPAEAGQVVPR